MKKKIAISLLTAFLFYTSVVRADDSYQVETTYFASSEDATYEFHKKLTDNGVDYKLVDVKYEVIKTNPIILSKEYKNLEQPQVENTILEDEIRYTLKNSSYIEAETEDGTQLLTHTETYGFRTSQPDVPSTWQIDYVDNGEEKQATASLAAISASDTRWQDGYQFNAIYYGDADVLYYDFNGSLIPNNETGVPYLGYEEIILNSLSLSTSNTQINSATWTGTVLNGRTAVFNCSMLGSEYAATYTVTVPNHKTVYNVNAEYALADVNEAYEIKATAIYKKDYMAIFAKAFLGLIIIAALIIIGILFAMRKRRRKKEDATG